jgi:rod shape-determining protein MreC
MALLDIRQRAGYLFLAVLLGHVILISAQINTRSGVPVLESVTFGFFAEVQRATASVVGGLRQVWRDYVDLRGVRVQNDLMRRQLAEAQVALQEQRALADRGRGLEKLLELRDRTSLKTTGAEIIASGASSDFKTVTIDKGTRQGVRTDMAVIAPAGIVGRVVVPSAGAAKVQLLIDSQAAAGAIIERRESRAQGIVYGSGEKLLRMDNVSEAADVLVGDIVVTSGIDGVYPKGLIIGRVAVVEKKGPAYSRLLVKPAVDFSSLEEVLVVVTPNAAREADEEPPR